jgi:hypothetical protein
MRRALLVSLLGLLGTTGCASGGSRSAGVVAWVNRPLPLYRAPDPTPISYPTTAPLCRARRLRVSRGPRGAATGHVLEELVFRNAGSRPCLLRGYPTISVESPTGGRTVLDPHYGTFFVPLVPANVRPGRRAFLEIETDDLCDLGRHPIVRYRDLSVRLPWGGTVDAGNVSIEKQCGLSISEFGLPERYGPVRVPGTAGTLRAEVHLASRLRVGLTDIRYTVTLRNPTARAVRLRSCPGYTESVYSGRIAVRRSFRLNCETVHVIRAHGVVRYAMRLILLRPLRAVSAKFGWSLDTPNGPFVGKALVVARS